MRRKILGSRTAVLEVRIHLPPAASLQTCLHRLGTPDLYRYPAIYGVNRYVNYLADDERGEEVLTAYGPNYRRLQQIKVKYEPKNFFHMNPWTPANVLRL